MKRFLCNKKTLIIAQAAFALLVIMSMFFCFSYYAWSSDVYKTTGFELLRDFGAFGVGLLTSLVLCAIILIGNFLRLFNIKLFRQNRLCFAVIAISVVVSIWSIIVFACMRGSVMIDTLDGGGESKFLRGMGVYMYMIFSVLMLVVSVFEVFYIRMRLNKERGGNERI